GPSRTAHWFGLRHQRQKRTEVLQPERPAENCEHGAPLMTDGSLRRTERTFQDCAPRVIESRPGAGKLSKFWILSLLYSDYAGHKRLGCAATHSVARPWGRSPRCAVLFHN